MSKTLSMTQDQPLAEKPSRPQVWFQAVRFFSFTASVVPIVVGSALSLANGAFSLWLFLAMLVASILCHAGANLANDYYDHKKGIDTIDSLGPSKVIQQELLTPAEVKRGMLVAFAIASVVGLAIVAASGWQILIIALASLAVAFLYTGGPKPLAHIGLGEVAVFLFMGPVMVCGSYYVLSEEVTLESVLISLPVACLVAAILHANNIRDIDFDRKAGKITLATRFGRKFANLEYAFLIVLAYVFTVASVLYEPSDWPILVAFATVLMAIKLVRIVLRDSGPMELNGVLRGTAGLHLKFGLLMTAGLMFRWLMGT
jgi:1,4-dihydroxy-2-naphthoate polyprenyltransferase